MSSRKARRDICVITQFIRFTIREWSLGSTDSLEFSDRCHRSRKRRKEPPDPVCTYQQATHLNCNTSLAIVTCFSLVMIRCARYSFGLLFPVFQSKNYVRF